MHKKNIHIIILGAMYPADLYLCCLEGIKDWWQIGGKLNFLPQKTPLKSKLLQTAKTLKPRQDKPSLTYANYTKPWFITVSVTLFWFIGGQD